MHGKRCSARRTGKTHVNASSGGRHQPRRRLATRQQRSTVSAASSPTTPATAGPGGVISTSNSCDSGSDEDESSSSSLSASTDGPIAVGNKKHCIVNGPAKEDGNAMQTKLDWKLVSLYTLLVLQVLVVVLYVASMPHVSDLSNGPVALRNTISFVHNDRDPPVHYDEGQAAERWHAIGTETTLRETKTFRLFQAYNQILCWRSGVDDRRMRRDLVDAGGGTVDRCACLPGWHGSDCGQPEVVWRAIMASKQNVQLTRRKLTRRLVHTFYVHDYNAAITEVIVEELYPVVDLFVVCDFSLAEDNFRHRLAKGFLGKQQDKILYLNVASKAKKPAGVISKYVWEQVRQVVKNLRDDDICVTTDAEQILNGRALMFLKTYDGWPQPIGFRLRWSVFGFFWQHPSRTRISLGASSLGLVRDSYYRLVDDNRDSDNGGDSNYSPMLPEREEPIASNEVLAEQQRDSIGLVIGDLNHYGGWYCQFCQGPGNIIAALREKNRTKEVVLLQQLLAGRNVDVPFIEDLIGSGTWFDEKTSLLRAYRSRDAYYAPETVLNNTWKYDWLVENFYAKLDYY
ncbi:beta-1,4-mannosyl-glycoprotein 4-beta-N-acetylglucosaminyltransferase isoform X2 [Copidosoma floridanum]|uniref:beta-1,4-mannosyl-glycoprotein 4-beta-N-acetylglucosaminyltransferase isoform X2 n=1 Tax=Copidosoma floridanum TaxID=29053 RepID=UPI000C6F7340|nr:beta-1,4-mannosyl-glycoprotein 4-beta-N-acetylglucosaminyltransferase isoform X2 [Copidosoma floridanum]